MNAHLVPMINLSDAAFDEMTRQQQPGAAPTAQLQDDGLHLIVDLASGQIAVLTAALLWEECPSAAGRRRRMAPHPPEATQGLTIVRVDPIGRYGINIAFSDGHDRGIYPWDFLKTLAARPSVDDFIIPP